MLIIALYSGVAAQNASKMEDNSNKLAVLWTSGDPDVAEKMGFMYTYNAKKQGWFDEVVLIVWGPSAKLLTENKMLIVHERLFGNNSLQSIIKNQRYEILLEKGIEADLPFTYIEVVRIMGRGHFYRTAPEFHIYIIIRYHFDGPAGKR